MGSQSLEGHESPSASSTFLIPQLLQPRRGSLVSLSTTNQLDRETLSQALDLIHNSASQSETLTTFNEYTSPPPSSFGPESRTIASELHGGLTGLYSRFRASVENVKEIVNHGSEELARDTLTPSNEKGNDKSSTSPAKGIVQSVQATSFSVENSQDSLQSTSRQQSMISVTSAEATQNDRIWQLNQSKFSSGILESPPTTLNHPAQSSTIGPTLAQVHVGPVIQRVRGVEPLTSRTDVSPVQPYQPGEDAMLPNSRHIYGTKTNSDDGAILHSEALSSNKLALNISGQRAALSGSDLTRISDANIYGDGNRVTLESHSSVQPFPGLESDEHDEDSNAVTEASSDADENGTGTPGMTTRYGEGQGNGFKSSERILESVTTPMFTKQGRSQRLALPVRKTVAPPLISRSDSPNPSLSRASSYEATSSKLVNPLPSSSPKHMHNDTSQLANGKLIASRTLDSSAFHQSLRTMNVFSQVKNKVLNKEYWMKDENARDCFYCGDSFTMVRRKHHCSK